HVNTDTTTKVESDPAVTVLDNGFIVVSWTYPYNAGVDDDIYYRVFDQNGHPVSFNGSSGVHSLDISTDDETHSALSTIFAGKFMAAWQDSTSDGAGGRISGSVQEFVRTKRATTRRRL